MAISAGTVAKERTRRSDSAKSVIESIKNFLSSSVSIKQGDLVALDTSAHVLKVVSTTADSANFLGVMPVTIVSGHLQGPYEGLTAVDAAQALGEARGPVYGATFTLKLKAGDAFNPGSKVYLADGQDSQTVTVTDPGDGNHIGIFVDAAVASAASGQEASIKIGARYGAASLLL